MADTNKTAAQKTGDAIRSSGEFLKNLLGYSADLREAAPQGIARNVTGALSTVGDIAAFGTDVATDLFNPGKGTNFSGSEGFLDKLDKATEKRTSKGGVMDVIKSKWGDTDAGRAGLDLTKGAAGFLVPTGIATKSISGIGKGVKLTKGAVNAIKNEPKLRKELNSLKTIGKEITQSDVDNILSKYGVETINKARTNYSLIADKSDIEKDIYDKIKNFTPEQIDKLPKTLKEKLFKAGTNLAGATAISGIINKDHNNTGIELGIDKSLSDDEKDIINKVSGVNKENNKEDIEHKSLNYNGRDIEKSGDKYIFKSALGGQREFNSLDEAKKAVDEGIKGYNDFKNKLQKGFNNKSTLLSDEEKAQYILDLLGLKEDSSLNDLQKALEKKGFTEDQLKKIVEGIENPSDTLNF